MGIETALIAGAIGTAGAAAMDAKSQKKAISSAEAQKAASQKFIQEQIDKARGDIFKLYPQAQASRQQGLQTGLNLYSQAFPAQLQAFQQGNTAAQQALINGLPQMNNAILGQRLNLSGLQPQTIQVNPQSLPGLYNPQPLPLAPIEGGN